MLLKRELFPCSAPPEADDLFPRPDLATPWPPRAAEVKTSRSEPGGLGLDGGEGGGIIADSCGERKVKVLGPFVGFNVCVSSA